MFDDERTSRGRGMGGGLEDTNYSVVEWELRFLFLPYTFFEYMTEGVGSPCCFVDFAWVYGGFSV